MSRKGEVLAVGATVRPQAGRLRVLRRASGRALRSPVAPALAVFLAYGWWLLSAFGAGHAARDFIVIGRQFVLQGHSSRTIKLDPRYHYPAGSTGYDGQFAYFIALDPLHARDYLDTHGKDSAGPDYRYTRILYPVLARTLALGQPAAIPYSLLAINWLALALGTLALAAWLRRKGLSPWFALLYGLYPGLFVALQRDLNEALAYGLVALAVYLYDLEGGRARVGAGLAFGLAALARETTLVFPLVYVAADLVRRPHAEERGPAYAGPTRALFALLSFVPFLLWKAFLFFWLGTIGRSGGVYPQPVPLRGLFSYWPWGSDGIEQLVAVVLPAAVCLAVFVWSVVRYPRHPEPWALGLNVLLFVVLLNTKSYVEYYASGRVTAGVVLAALCCLPLSRHWRRPFRWWIWPCALLWLSLFPALEVVPRRAVRPSDALIVAGAVLALGVVTQLTTPPPHRVAGPPQGARAGVR